MDWIFNINEKRVGKFVLSKNISDYSNEVVKLIRYDYEDCDTYEIKDSNYSKLFVKDNKIRAIQCGKEFIIKGKQLINSSIDNITHNFNTHFEITNDDGGGTWESEELGITIYTVSHKIRWIIYHNWKEDIKQAK